MPLRTRLSDLFASVRVPLVSAPMAGASGGLLAARVCQAGAFGFIGAGHADRAFLAQELDIARKELSLPQGRLPIGVGFITWRLEEQDSPEEVLKSLAPQVSCIWFAFGKHIQRWVSAVKSQQGCRTAVLVSSVDAAVAASSWPTPPDIIVVQGSEAGGHGSHDSLPIVSFVPAVLDALRGGAQRPLVLAAGGISRGTQLASMLALGADGVVAGTRFLATPEALYSPAQKERILRGKGEDTLRTILFDRMRGTLGWDSHIGGRALSNTTVEDSLAGVPDDELKRLYETAVKRGDVDRIVTWAGTSVGSVTELMPAGEVVAEYEREALASIARLAAQLA